MKKISSAALIVLLLILAGINSGCKKEQRKPYVLSSELASETPYGQQYDISWDKQFGTTEIQARFWERDQFGSPIHLNSPALVQVNNEHMTVRSDSVTYSWSDSSVTDIQISLTKNNGSKLLNYFALSEIDNVNFDPNLSVRFRKSDGITVRWIGPSLEDGESLSTYIEGTNINDDLQSEPVSTIARVFTSRAETFSPEMLSNLRKGTIHIILVKTKNIRPQPDGSAIGSGSMKLSIAHEAQLE